jgi:cell division transport system permease protein
MITLFIKKALQDLIANRFLNTITIITIGLSVLIVSSFALFFLNANTVLNSWKKGIRVLVYLKTEADEASITALKHRIQNMQGIQDIRLISKEDALSQLKEQMKHQSSLLENLETNPLPDAFEIRVPATSQDMHEIDVLAKKIEALPLVDQVEYGQHWIGRFTNILNLFKFAGYTMGSLFVIATLFIIANTIRLVLYSRKEEVEIMRLVGATDRFIKMPFYIQGFMLGALGGLFGMMALFAAYQFILAKFQPNLSVGLFEIGFLSLKHFFYFIFGSMIIGWVGCYLSLKQFLKK